MENKQKIKIVGDIQKEKYLVAIDNIYPGEIIFEEKPLLTVLLNNNNDNNKLNLECFCHNCMKPWFNGDDAKQILNKMQTRWSKYIDIYPIQQWSNRCNIIKCGRCDKLYCSEECHRQSCEGYYSTVCSFIQKHGKLVDPIYIGILKILIQTSHEPEFLSKLKQLPQQQDKFWVSCDISLLKSLLNNDDTLKHFLNDENKLDSLITLCSKLKWQPIQTSAFYEWMEDCQRKAANDGTKLEQVTEMFEDLEKGLKKDSHLMNEKGFGVFEMQSFIKNNEQSNCEICFPQNDYKLAIKATEAIYPGEELKLSIPGVNVDVNNDVDFDQGEFYSDSD